jgi:AraC-like DNA-binding protein
VAHPRLSLGSVCEFLGVAPRTLQHWLKQEGRSFQGIVDEVRFELASDLLESGELPIADVALASGFVSPAAFTRAFTKWAGVPPSAYLRSH